MELGSIERLKLVREYGEDITEYVAILMGQLHELMVCLSNSWGGLEQVAFKDACDIASLGLDVTFMCLKGSPVHDQLLAQISSPSPVKIFAIDYRPRDYFDFHLRKDLHALVDVTSAAPVNLIHTHQTSLLGTLSPWLWNQRQVALIASRHILNNHDKRNFFHHALYSRLDSLVVMSQTLRANVLATHPLRDKQVKVINLGLDFDRFDPVKADARAQRAKWGADEKTVVIGIVGRIDPAKGQATFLRAAAGLLNRSNDGEKFKFVLVGEETRGGDTTHLEELQSMIRQFHIENEVVFSGFQDNIPEVMAAFDIFVMPSRQEAFGLVAIEAMAMETPLVISRGGSASEIVGNEEFGLLMRSDDAFDLQRQLRWFLDHPEERREMGKKARLYVRENYDRKMRLLRTLSLYERSLRRRRLLE